MRPIILMTMLAALTACATQPQEATTVSTSPASPAAAATAAPATAGDAAASETEFRAPAGYDTKTRGGKTVYCRSQTPVGTRFPTEYCFTQADLERMERNKRSMQDDVEQRTRMCSSGAGCSGGG